MNVDMGSAAAISLAAGTCQMSPCSNLPAATIDGVFYLPIVTRIIQIFQGDCVWCNDDNMSPTVWTFTSLPLRADNGFVAHSAIGISTSFHITWSSSSETYPLIVSQENHMVSWLEIFNIISLDPYTRLLAGVRDKITAFGIS